MTEAGLIPPCPHRPPCRACPRYGERGIAPRAAQALNELALIHGLPPVAVVSGAPTGFRLRARLAVRGRVGAPKIGLFESGTHRLVHVPNCRVHHPLINRVARLVSDALADARVPSYSEAAHLGLTRYVQVVVERSSQSAQVVLVGNSPDATPFAAGLALIQQRLGSDLHSLWYNANCERTNAILGAHFERWTGPASVVEHFGGAAVHYPPGAFGQSNLEIAACIIEHLRTKIPSGARVTEFYAGVGAIGLSLLGAVRELRLNEVSPPSLQGLEQGVAALDASERSKVEIIPGSAETALEAAADADVVIVDPPRKGLDAALSGHLGEHARQRLLYVSCDLDSLLRDTALLLAPGRLRLTGLTAFNLMPFTEHVETVACFEA